MEHTICTRLGERLRVLRKAKGWRLIDLSQHCGISEKYISKVERGEKEVCLLALASIARALNVTLSELLSGIE